MSRRTCTPTLQASNAGARPFVRWSRFLTCWRPASAVLERRQNCSRSRKSRPRFLHRNLRRFGKTLHALEPKERDSRWSEYQAAADHYSDQQRQRKQEFVDRAMQLLRPESVLDIGGNTGQYSRIAAARGRARSRLGHRCRFFRSQLEGGQGGWAAHTSFGR